MRVAPAIAVNLVAYCAYRPSVGGQFLSHFFSLGCCIAIVTPFVERHVCHDITQVANALKNTIAKVAAFEVKTAHALMVGTLSIRHGRCAGESGVLCRR